MSKKNGKNVVITINGINDAELIGAIKYLVTTGNGTMTISEGSDQTTKTTTTKAKASKSDSKVVYTDKKGRKWLVKFGKGEFPQAEYEAKKTEMINNGTYNGSDPRAKVYKALGWIL